MRSIEFNVAVLGLAASALAFALACTVESTTDLTGVEQVNTPVGGGSGGGSDGGNGDDGSAGGGQGEADGGTGVGLSGGVFPSPVSNPEALYFAGDCLGNLCASEGPAGDRTLITLAGAQGQVIVDLQSRTTVLDSTFPGGDPDATGNFGWVPVSQPTPGPTTPTALFNFAETGGGLLNYDTGRQSFEVFTQVFFGNFLDATTAGDQLVSDEVIACADGGPFTLTFNALDGEYVIGRDGSGDLVSFDVGRGCVSMITASPLGPVLSVSRTGGSFTDSRLYFTDRTAAEATEIGTLGIDSRRIRHAGGIAVASVFGDDTLQPILWDGANAPTIVGSGVAVGDGPVGIDLRDTGPTGVQVASTGFNDDSVWITLIAPDGSVTANDGYDAPAGCSSPGHVIFIENDADPSDPFVTGTCFGNDQIFVSKISELTELRPE